MAGNFVAPAGAGVLCPRASPNLMDYIGKGGDLMVKLELSNTGVQANVLKGDYKGSASFHPYRELRLPADVIRRPTAGIRLTGVLAIIFGLTCVLPLFGRTTRDRLVGVAGVVLTGTGVLLVAKGPREEVSVFRNQAGAVAFAVTVGSQNRSAAKAFIDDVERRIRNAKP